VVLYSPADKTCFHCRRALAPVVEQFGPFPGPGWVERFTSSAGNLTLYQLGPTAQWPSGLPAAVVPADPT
jgi:hypothetical protein